jgi:thiamine transport system substrate-binding protein
MSSRPRPTPLLRFGLAVFLAVSVAAAGCSNDDDTPRVRLLAYDSFPTGDTGINEALAEFTADTGIGVELVIAGDTGAMVSKAVLTSGNPEADVIFGVDDTFLTRAVNGDVFADAPEPVDFGDVCVNYDLEWFTNAGVVPPTSLAELTDPRYRDLLVVQDPSTSAPGMAFLLATIAEFGEPGWQQYWADLRANGVTVVDSWTTAYNERFTRNGGDRPLVVSYGTSPPAEVVFADPPRDDAPTGAIASTCYRTTEYAGVLRGTTNTAEARQLLEFLTSPRFQQELALSIFVYPVSDQVVLPDEFVRFAVMPDEPYSLPATEIDANRTTWQDQWTQIVLR